MYAIICDGGRQFKVKEGQLLDIDYRDTAVTGDKVDFDRVLAIGGDAGAKAGAANFGRCQGERFGGWLGAR